MKSIANHLRFVRLWTVAQTRDQPLANKFSTGQLRIALTSDKMPHWPLSVRYRAIGMMEAGLSVREISTRLSVPLQTLYRWITRFEHEGQVERHAGSGRPHSTSARSNRRLIRLCRRNPFHSSAQLLTLWDEQVTSRTVRNRLVNAGLRSRRLLRRPLLASHHRLARLRWAMNRCHFREPQWRKIIFTDESRYLLRPVDGRLRVRRYRGEFLREDLVSEVTPHGGGSVMVWGAICCDGRSRLIVLPGSLNGQRYRQVLENHLIPWAEALLGPRETAWRLQDDNAPPHRSQAVREFQEASRIRRIDWPARSPDLNPIEHLWDEVGRRVKQRDPPPASLAQLANALREEWEAVPQSIIRHLILSMPRRVRQVLQARGGHTCY